MSKRYLAAFSLLEVTIALAIIALIGGGVMRINSYHVRNTASLQERRVAQWVADDALTQYRLDRQLRPDIRIIEAGQRMWPVTVSEEPSDLVGLIRVVVHVYPPVTDESQSGFASPEEPLFSREALLVTANLSANNNAP